MPSWTNRRRSRTLCYGTLLPWPEPTNPDEARPRRIPGAWVILLAGRPVLYVGPRARSLTTFPGSVHDEPELALALQALARLPRTGDRGYRVIERIDGRPVRESPLYPLLRDCGFESDYRGLGLPAPGTGRGL